ncbi:MAG: hypothetical protein K9J37_21520 [Saprospiraceae bacterium]|nr:hypothetical protein [Saprospiraceae bacterium]MCF8252502.1 hypothetical protein [Saprospiraceae bacterium]MCF8282526.1 hypothetical protein [Bacteroidales bacterium]MCF8314109.1 hypothetical protein [Saprospiraceae bacterium]MCF8442856.1 hypothetical protein [Saprospiraceae bacterium]
MRSEKIQKLEADLIADGAEKDSLGRLPAIWKVGGGERIGPAVQVLGALAIVVDVLENGGLRRRNGVEVNPLKLRSELKIRTEGGKDGRVVVKAMGK